MVTHSRRAVLHLVEVNDDGAPNDGAADTTLDRVHAWASEFLERTEEETEILLVEQRRLQRSLD